MQERFYKSLLRTDSDPLLPVVLTHRLCRTLPMDERKGIVFIAHVAERLYGLQKRTEGYYDIGFSAEQSPAIVVRMIALEPGVWDPSTGTDELRAPVQAEVVDDQLLKLLLPVGSVEGDLSPETMENGRAALQELATRWRETEDEEERILEAVKHSGPGPSQLERMTAALLMELDRGTDLYQTLRETYRKERDQQQGEEEQADLFRQLRQDLPLPLQSMERVLDRLRQTELSEDQKQCVEQLSETTEQVVQLVTDAVDLSRIKSGSFTVSEETVDLSSFMDDCLSLFHERADEEQVELTYEIAPDVPSTLWFDPGTMRQVLVHVIERAYEHSNEDSVVVRIEREHQNGLMYWMWEVRHTGEEISGMERDHAGEANAPEAPIEGQTGTGIEFAIAGRLVEAMDGWVEERNHFGEGLLFRFGLPVKTDRRREQRESGEPEGEIDDSLSLTGKRVLVATDDTTTMNTMKRILESLDASLSTVDHVVERDGDVRLFPEDEQEFDAIFINPHMSGLNGLELLETLHRNRSMEHVVPIASSPFERKNRHYAASYGIQYFLSEPISSHDVLEVVRSMFDIEPDAEPDPTDQPSSGPLASVDVPVRLLLVEDNDLNRDFMCRLLEAHPIDVTCATTGQEALDRYEERGGDIDVIFMDLKMPDLNGIEAARAIRDLEAEEARARTPIVALTAETASNRVEQSLEAGCDAHVSKPVDVNRVLEAIRNQLGDG